jgi:hypothetical protein
MPSLRELQLSFSAATMFGDDAALSSLAIVPGGIDPRERMAIYRNNVFGNYCKVMAATYPVVRRLVGAPFFTAATEQFVRAHPSTRGDVNGYGGDFARFLETYAPAHERTSPTSRASSGRSIRRRSPLTLDRWISLHWAPSPPKRLPTCAFARIRQRGCSRRPSRCSRSGNSTSRATKATTTLT